MTAFLRCMCCEVIFIRPQLYTEHVCADRIPAVDGLPTEHLARLRASKLRHPSNPSGDVS
jgi:hypothetical protein